MTKQIYLPELAGLSSDELALLIKQVKKEPKSESRDRILTKLRLLQEIKKEGYDKI